MLTNRIQHLVELYFSDSITDIQKIELAEWIVQRHNDEEIRGLLEKAFLNYEADAIMPDEVSDKIIASFFDIETSFQITGKPVRVIDIFPSRKWWKLSVAVACVIIFISGTYLFSGSNKNNKVAKKDLSKQQLINDIKPGGQKAILTLSDGSQIVLDSASNGVIAQQGNAQVVKLTNGQVSYLTNGSAARGKLYNTMATPVGGIFLLLLPDGSKVWLNSASSIRYPTEFANKERRVQITGEAYFEVAKNAGQPFVVSINNNAEIRVLGTHFNVSTYDDESEIKTTLLEGAVNILQGNKKNLLKPGQQAQIDKSGFIKLIYNADIEEAIAWKNGNFQFSSAGLQTVLRQASRWYNLEVVYEGKIPSDKFSGKISRYVNLTSFLKWMEWSDVHFKLEGKKLIVLP